MNVLLDIKQVAAQDVSSLRESYLDQLPFAQDALLETLLSSATFFMLHARGEHLGYCAVGQDGALLEFYLVPAALYLSHTVFPELLRKRELKTALVKSFDSLALSCALDQSRRVKVVGMLVRDYTPRPLPNLGRIEYSSRVAHPSDFSSVVAVEQDVFTHPERLKHVIEQQQLLLFEKGEQLIGFGILRPVIIGRPDVEVGIAVDAPFRNKGYSAYILRDLVEHCLNEGKTPVSGCSIENLPSIRLGQRIGLCARHRLLEIEFAEQRTHF